MSYVNTRPGYRKPSTPAVTAAVCPVCDRGIVAQGLRAHLQSATTKNGHGMDAARAMLYAARAIALANVAARELAEKGK